MKNKLLLLGLTTLTLSLTSCSIINVPGSSGGKTITDELFEFLQEHYYLEMSDREIIDGMISGLTQAYDDPFTYYTSAAKGEEQDYSTSGVGLGFSRSIYYGEALVTQVMKNSPAEKAGLLEDDIIYKLRNVNNDGTYADYFVLKDNPYASWTNAFLGEKSTVIEVYIKRKDESGKYVEVKEPLLVTRDNYNVDKARLIDFTNVEGKSEAYVEISSFLGDPKFNETTPQDELKEIFDNEIFDQVDTLDHLIIDLRGNGGGYVDNCVSTLGLFIPKGEITGYYQYKDGSYKSLPNIDQDKQYTSQIDEITLLVDSNTASAGESFTLGLRDSSYTKDKVTVAGQVSFGKGIAQGFLGVFNDGSLIRYTFAKVLSPSKNCINKRGIVPDIFLGEEYIPYEELRKEINGVSDNTLLSEKDQKIIKHRIELLFNHTFSSLDESVVTFKKAMKLEETPLYDKECARILADEVFDRIIFNYDHNVYVGHVEGVTNNDDLSSSQRKFIKEKINYLLNEDNHSFDLAIRSFQKKYDIENEEHIYDKKTADLLQGLVMDIHLNNYEGVVDSVRK